MTDLLHLNLDVLLRNEHGIWLASNPRLRCHVELDTEAIVALVNGAKGQSVNLWLQALARASGHDRTDRMLGSKGLHADPSGLSPTPSGTFLGEKLLELLRRRRILIGSNVETNDLLRPLVSPLDVDSLGTFHQRVGQYLFRHRQKEYWRAWHSQKFTPDGLHLQPGAYKDIQAPFFDAYFSAERMLGKRILDFGCGNGYFSALMAQAGASVLALDNSPELLALARANHGRDNRLQFIETPTFDEVIDLLDRQQSGSFDFVSLQDTLLLLMRPERGHTSPQLLNLFKAFHRALKPNGRLLAMEPNAVFWLSGRYGNPLGPYAIVTEYYHPVFNVVPRLEEIIDFMMSAGFALYEYCHPRRLKEEASYEDEFPIWDFYVFGRAVQ